MEAQHRDQLTKERNTRIHAERRAEEDAARHLSANQQKWQEQTANEQQAEEDERSRRAEVMRQQRKKVREREREIEIHRKKYRKKPTIHKYINKFMYSITSIKRTCPRTQEAEALIGGRTHAARDKFEHHSSSATATTTATTTTNRPPPRRLKEFNPVNNSTR